MQLPKVYITMLGKFQITIGDKTISDQDNTLKKPFLLLQYLIANRKKNIQQNDIIEALWPHEEIKNPVASLKTLIYRVRKVLEEFHLSEVEFIIQSGGTYRWNHQLPTFLDIDLFEKSIYEGDNTKLSLNERMMKYRNGISLYEGEFLPRISLEPWVVPMTSYYHYVYLNGVYKALAVLLELKLYDEMTSLCNKALEFDPYDEEIHYYLILSLFELKNRKAALQHYRYTCEMLLNKLGITPSDKINTLHKKILETNEKIETNMALIIENLEESEETPGPFYCEYGIFRDIYQFHQRSCKRTGSLLYLGVITAHNRSYQPPDMTLVSEVMEELKGSIQQNIRATDTFTRYSISQFLIMLPQTPGKIGEEVMKRIIRNFYTRYSNLNVQLSYSSNNNVFVTDVRKKSL